MQHAEGRLMSVHWSASGLMEFVQHWLHNGHPDRVLLLLNVVLWTLLLGLVPVALPRAAAMIPATHAPAAQ